jgi:hypothetical protein
VSDNRRDGELGVRKRCLQNSAMRRYLSGRIAKSLLLVILSRGCGVFQDRLLRLTTSLDAGNSTQQVAAHEISVFDERKAADMMLNGIGTFQHS